MKHKKLVCWLGGCLVVLMAVVAVIVFFVLPTYFAPTQQEVKSFSEQTDVDSLSQQAEEAIPDDPFAGSADPFADSADTTSSRAADSADTTSSRAAE